MEDAEPIPSHAATPASPPRRRPTYRRVRRGLVAFAVLLAAWMAISFCVASRLTRRMQPAIPETAPEVAWGPMEQHRLLASDGLRIGAWYAEGRAEAPALLFLHGSGASRAQCLGRAALLRPEIGCALMFITLRAHGDSDGDYDDIGYGARRDVVAAVDFLGARRPGRPIFVVGASLGSAAATFAAAELGEKVDGYVLESPYRDLKTAVWNRTQVLPAPLDRAAYLGLRLAAFVLLPHLDAISPVRAIAGVPDDVPVLILAGGSDDLATVAEAEAIHERVRTHGRLEVFPGARHNELAVVDPDRYTRTIVAFVAGACRDRR
ncbi:alpha/beta hydrolase [Paludisphaera mucosa]|uniref:Alpha/beta fold hydrolase n=1 Tax=Paludisphaera mucosa TaxID=3030827 RepID=A0ABT6FH00_9BACT|nr:alpha/beta fold hydrolase [Paludisphaera mucosa]MDG3006673.1 alpha/beta fold hydrolase [Paludisphaera mucosa]